MATGFGPQDDAHHLDTLAETSGVEVSGDVREHLLRFLAFTAEWSQKTNLVGAKSPEQLVELTCLDAFHLVSGLFVGPNMRVVDVGAGAGAPGITVALMLPNLKVTLVEPRTKRAAFLRLAVETMGIGDRVDVVEKKVDPQKPSLEGTPFDVAWARAVFPPAAWSALGPSLGKRTVLFLTRQPGEVIPEVRVANERHYRVPSSGSLRWLASTEPS